jgi:FRG domain
MYKTEVINGASPSKDFDAKSFLEYLRPSNEVWLSTFQGTRHEWVFRGHSDEAWKLVPPIGRTSDRKLVKKIVALVRELKPTSTWQKSSKNERRETATIALYVTLIRKFVSVCYDVGAWDVPPEKDPFQNGLPLMCSNPGGRLLQPNRPSISPLTHDVLEDGICKRGKAIQFPGNKLAVAALAQHHGIPTFLLDWSDNSLVAAYFASQVVGFEKDICIWALDMSHLNSSYSRTCPFGVNRPPKSTNKFLHAQAGLLTYLRNDYGLWNQIGTYPCMEKIIQEWNRENKRTTWIVQKSEDDVRTEDDIWDQDHGCVLLKKIILKKQHVKPLRELLRYERISKEYLMPSFDNIAAEAKRVCL